MDPKFQTSFIPKKPSITQGSGIVSQRPKKHISSIYMMIAVVVLIASIGAVGGAYLWKQYLVSKQASYKTQLAERERQFNLDLVQQLKQINVQIDSAKELLKKHIALSQIFNIIQQMTISNVRFTSMEVSSPSSQNNSVNISLDGYGTNLAAVAFQSDVFGQLSQYGLQKIIKNPIMSDPVINGDGTVSFGFTAMIEPGSVSYGQTIVGSDTVSTSSTQQ